MKNLLFFKIVTNRYLKMYSLLIIIGWAYTPHICNKHKKKKEIWWCLLLLLYICASIK